MLNQQIPPRFPVPHPEAKFVQFTVFTGPMFSGKSSALISQGRRFVHAQGIMLAFRPLRDTRDPQESLVSHDGAQFPATRVETAWEILDVVLPQRARQLETRDEGLFGVCIDEVNLYPDKERILDVVVRLRAEGIFVFCAGLTTDYKGDPFDPIPELLAHADAVHKFKARCEGCQRDEDNRQYWSATYTLRTTTTDERDTHVAAEGAAEGEDIEPAAETAAETSEEAGQILVGGREQYMPLCVHCLLTLGEHAGDHRLLRSYTKPTHHAEETPLPPAPPLLDPTGG